MKTKSRLAEQAFDSLENAVEKQVKKSVLEQVKEIPGQIKTKIMGAENNGRSMMLPIGIGAGLSWFSGLGSILSMSPFSLNLGYNLAVGAGLAGGALADSKAQKIVTGAALTVAMAPEIIYNLTTDNNYSFSGMAVKGAAFTACYLGTRKVKNWWKGN